jgi:hypothetical protein
MVFVTANRGTNIVGKQIRNPNCRQSLSRADAAEGLRPGVR